MPPISTLWTGWGLALVLNQRPTSQTPPTSGDEHPLHISLRADRREVVRSHVVTAGSRLVTQAHTLQGGPIQFTSSTPRLACPARAAGDGGRIEPSSSATVNSRKGKAARWVAHICPRTQKSRFDIQHGDVVGGLGDFRLEYTITANDRRNHSCRGCPLVALHFRIAPDPAPARAPSFLANFVTEIGYVAIEPMRQSRLRCIPVAR